MPSEEKSAGLKSNAAIGQSLERRYQRVWVDELLEPGSCSWPYEVRVGRPSQRELEQNYAWWDAQAKSRVQWAGDRGLTCAFESRRVGRHSYSFLSHVCAADAVSLAGATGHKEHFGLYGWRLERLREQFPLVDAAGLRRVLVAMNKGSMSDEDFELVCTAASWFACNEVEGMSAREVPLEGFHAKWLDAAGHRTMVCTLAGKQQLAFRERPRVVMFRYLDPAYIESGGRVHDCWVEGDLGKPVYTPVVVVICENRDSALWFRPVDGGIAVQGDGMAGASVVGSIPWIASAPRVVYWGDIDRQGFEILSKYREGGLTVHSVLMDSETYARFERFGTYVDKAGREIAPKPDAHALPGLTEAENALYLRLCSPDFSGPRRIEQERIPLELAQMQVAPRTS